MTGPQTTEERRMSTTAADPAGRHGAHIKKRTDPTVFGPGAKKKKPVRGEAANDAVRKAFPALRGFGAPSPTPPGMEIGEGVSGGVSDAREGTRTENTVVVVIVDEPLPCRFYGGMGGGDGDGDGYLTGECAYCTSCGMLVDERTGVVRRTRERVRTTPVSQRSGEMQETRKLTGDAGGWAEGAGARDEGADDISWGTGSPGWHVRRLASSLPVAWVFCMLWVDGHGLVWETLGLKIW